MYSSYDKKGKSALPPHEYPSTGLIPVGSANSSDRGYCQGRSAPPIPRAPVPWSSGLCSCFSDVENCCLTLWCPCITFGRIAEIVDKGSTSCRASGVLYVLILCVTGCTCMYSCFYRSKMRQQHALEAVPCGDCLVHCFCEYCALCQEYRELEHRGYKMQIGWLGNIEEKEREVAMNPVAPSVEEGMSRF